MADKEDVKKTVYSLLLSSPMKMNIQQLSKDFFNLMGYNIPYAEFGFSSVEEYIRSLPDCIQVVGRGSYAELIVIPTAKSEHVDKLMAKQKTKHHRYRTSRVHVDRNYRQVNPRTTTRIPPLTEIYIPSHIQQKYGIGNYGNVLQQRNLALNPFQQMLPLPVYGMHFPNANYATVPSAAAMQQRAILGNTARISTKPDNRCFYNGNSNSTSTANYVQQKSTALTSTSQISPKSDNSKIHPSDNLPSSSSHVHHSSLPIAPKSDTKCYPNDNLNTSSPLLQQKSSGLNNKSTTTTHIQQEDACCNNQKLQNISPIPHKSDSIKLCDNYDSHVSSIHIQPSGAILNDPKSNNTPSKPYKADDKISPKRKNSRSDNVKKLQSKSQLEELSSYKETLMYFSDDEDNTPNTKVPLPVQNNLKLLIADYPDGLWCTKLYDLYRKRFHHELDYRQFGYSHMIQMCMDLEEIFYCYRPDSGDHKIYDKSKPLPKDYDKGITKSMYKLVYEMVTTVPALPDIDDWVQSQTLYPPDVMQLSDELIKQSLPPNLTPTDYIDLNIAEVYDPSKFWFIIASEDCSDKLTKLMDDMQLFYADNLHLIVADSHVEEGLFCVAIFNREYHRAIIINVAEKSSGHIKVFFVDYATISTVRVKEVCYLHRQFSELPMQAIRGRLANICPCYVKTPWNDEATSYFFQLVNDKNLVGQVFRFCEKDEVAELILADTTGDHEMFINDELVNKGYAIFANQEQLKIDLPFQSIPIIMSVHLVPTFDDIEKALVPSAIETSQLRKNGIPYHYIYPKYFQHYYVKEIPHSKGLNKTSTKSPTKPPTKSSLKTPTKPPTESPLESTELPIKSPSGITHAKNYLKTNSPNDVPSVHATLADNLPKINDTSQPIKPPPGFNVPLQHLPVLQNTTAQQSLLTNNNLFANQFVGNPSVQLHNLLPSDPNQIELLKSHVNYIQMLLNNLASQQNILNQEAVANKLYQEKLRYAYQATLCNNNFMFNQRGFPSSSVSPDYDPILVQNLLAHTSAQSLTAACAPTVNENQQIPFTQLRYSSQNLPQNLNSVPIANTVLRNTGHHTYIPENEPSQNLPNIFGTLQINAPDSTSNRVIDYAQQPTREEIPFNQITPKGTEHKVFALEFDNKIVHIIKYNNEKCMMIHEVLIAYLQPKFSIDQIQEVMTRLPGIININISLPEHFNLKRDLVRHNVLTQDFNSILRVTSVILVPDLIKTLTGCQFNSKHFSKVLHYCNYSI